MTDQTFSIVYTQHFTSGLLEGLDYGPTLLSFPTQDSRLNWLTGVKANQRKNDLNWVFKGDIFFYTDMADEDCLEDYKTWARVDDNV